MIDRIAQILHLEPDEARHALAFGAILCALTCSYTLVKTGRDALFLAKLPAATLPVVFLGVGILTTLAAALYARLTRNTPTWRSLEIAAGVGAGSLALFGYLFEFKDRWVPISFYVWVNVYGLILLSQFWSFLNSVSDPREAKRIFGIVGTGGILGGLIGGLLASPLERVGSLSWLLWVGAAMLVVVVPAVRATQRKGSLPPEERLEPATTDVGNPLRSSYVRWLALAAVCSVLVTTILDYQFKVEIQRRDPSPAALASFLGWFYTATNLAALTIQIVVTRWSLHKLGAGWSAAILPTGLGIGAAVIMTMPSFAAVITTRLWDQVMRLSINKTVVELFFFPLTPGLRRRAKAWIEAGLERLGDAIAGLLILAATAAMGGTTWTLAAMVVGLVIVWIAAWLGVRRGYVSELGRNLRRMNLDFQDLSVSLRESSLLQEMRRLLDSPYERLVLHGIEMLGENAPELLQPEIERLLKHESPRVRARVLSVADHWLTSEAQERIEEMMHDPDPEVRVAAMRARCVMGGEKPLDGLIEFLDSDEVNVRYGALYCIAEFAEVEEDDRLRDIFERWLGGDSVPDRVAVAEALGKRPATSALLEMITPLLDDERIDVRNAALVSAGRARRRALIPRMIELLAVRESRVAARTALAAFGNYMVGTLGDYLCDGNVAIEIRRELPRVLGLIGTRDSVSALFRCRERSDVRLIYRILKAANQIRTRSPEMPMPNDLILEDLDFDVRSYLFALVHYRSCPIGVGRNAERLLCIALNERMDQALNRVFRRLALMYPSAEILATYRGIVSENPRMRGNALEYVENALTEEHAALVLPIVGDTGDEALLKFAATRYGLRYSSFDDSLREILHANDPWLRTCALYVVGVRQNQDLKPAVQKNLSSRDRTVRETAAWANAALATG